MFVLPKVCTECEFLQLGGCSQVQSVALIAKTERLRDPESCAAETEINNTAKVKGEVEVGGGGWEGASVLGHILVMPRGIIFFVLCWFIVNTIF